MENGGRKKDKEVSQQGTARVTGFWGHEYRQDNKAVLFQYTVDIGIYARQRVKSSVGKAVNLIMQHMSV